MALKTIASEELPSVNMTPMIDVVFLLIVFFMVGTQFTEKEQQIELQLPGTETLQPLMKPPPRREVAVTANGQVMLDGKVRTLEELVTSLKDLRSSYPGLGVVVRADGKAEHQAVAEVYGAVNRAGVEDMSIAVRQQAVVR